jgi:hypothetical protein
MMAEERGLIDDMFLVTLFKVLSEHPSMTATQVIELVNEKGILVAPTLGRQETEYLGPMIEREIDVLNSLGLLPPMPPRLLEAQGEYQVVYTSPLALSQRAQEAAGFIRTVETAKEIVNITQDPSYLDVFDFDTALPEIAASRTRRNAGWRCGHDCRAPQVAGQSRRRSNSRYRRLPAQAAMKKANAVVGESRCRRRPGRNAGLADDARGSPRQERASQIGLSRDLYLAGRKGRADRPHRRTASVGSPRFDSHDRQHAFNEGRRDVLHAYRRDSTCLLDEIYQLRSPIARPKKEKTKMTDTPTPPAPPPHLRRPAPPTTPWYEGKLDAELIGHIENKGWKKDDPGRVAIEATKQARELQKHFGVPPDQLIKLPKDTTDEAGWRAVRERLGAPKEAKDYDLTSVKHADGKDIDTALADTLRAAMHKAGTPKDSAPEIVKATSSTWTTRRPPRPTSGRAACADRARRPARRSGAPTGSSTASRPCRARGAPPAPMKARPSSSKPCRTPSATRIRWSSGARSAPARPRTRSTTPTGGNPTTRNGAVARKAELMADKAWANRYLAGGANERREMDALNLLIQRGRGMSEPGRQDRPRRRRQPLRLQEAPTQRRASRARSKACGEAGRVRRPDVKELLHCLPPDALRHHRKRALRASVQGFREFPRPQSDRARRPRAQGNRRSGGRARVSALLASRGRASVRPR